MANPDSVAQTRRRTIPPGWSEPILLQSRTVPFTGAVTAHVGARSHALQGLEIGRTRLLATGAPGLAVGDDATLELWLSGHQVFVTAHVGRVALVGETALVEFGLGVSCPQGTDLIAELTKGHPVPPRRLSRAS